MTEPHATPAIEAHEASAHAPAGGHAVAAHDEQAEGAPLGPVDAQAWGAGILGLAVGGVVAVLLYLVSYH